MISAGSRVQLEPLTGAHVEPGFALIAASRDDLARWLPWARSSNRADFADFVARRRSAGDPFCAYAIMVDGRFAGSVDAHEHDAPNRVGSIGYWLGTAYIGHGWMTIAVQALTRDLFERRIVDRLEIYVAVGNERSARVAERSGYAFEAVLKSRLLIGDARHDASLYARCAPS